MHKKIMRQLGRCGLLLLGLFVLSGGVPLWAATTRTVGTSGDYATLKAAFDAINAGTVKGDITLYVISDTTETASAVLNASGTGSASYTSVLIEPAGGSWTISGSISAPLIDFNGADNVTIDGRQGGTGSTKDLTIDHPSTSYPAIRYINDAINNTIRYATVKGSNQFTPNYATGGVILFGTTTGTTGNDNNSIDHCDLRDSTGRTPAILVYSYGTSGKANSGNTISNCNIFNFAKTGSTAGDCGGVVLATGSDGFTIIGNSFYQTAALSPSITINFYPIWVTYGGNYTIQDNFIGGNGSGATGTWTMSGSASRVFGIYFNSSSTGISSIQNNTIKNFTLTGNSASIPLAGMYLFVSGGTVNIGTTTGNTLGSGTGTGSLSVEMSASGTVYGIYTDGFATTNISNNTIGSITTTVTNPSTVYAAIRGIYAHNPATVSNNTVGSATTANSINAASASSMSITAYMICGIYSELGATSSSAVTISGNLVANLTDAGTGSSIVDRGVYAYGGINTITGNTVRNITSKGIRLSGVELNSTTATGHTVARNIIHSLYNTNASSSVWCLGLFYSGPTSGTNAVERNFIHNLSVSSSNTLSTIYGVKLSGNMTFKNNMIQVGVAGGSSISTGYQIYGIHDVGGVIDCYFNSVYVGGNVDAGASTDWTSAYYRSSNTRSQIQYLMGNIFVNARSNTTGSLGAKHYAIYVDTLREITSDYNDLYAPGMGGRVGCVYTTSYSTLDDWRRYTGRDRNSLSGDPLFFAPASDGTSANLHITSTSSPVYRAATPVSGVTNDYDGETRCDSACDSLNLPDIGADQYSPTLVELISFKATAYPERVRLEWQTASELDNVGFYLLRANPGSHRFSRITTLIPAEGSPVTGNSYSHEDFDVALGESYRYKLEDVDSSGTSTFHGPVKATVGLITLVSPQANASVPSLPACRFDWESIPYDQFQLQFSRRADFKSRVITLPSGQASHGKWVEDPFYTPTDAEWASIRKLAARSGVVYWRVLGKTGSGAKQTSEVNRLIVENR